MTDRGSTVVGRADGAPTAVPPTELTTFIGRDRELADLAALLERSRLITLTGAGGSGKTRLALELVARAGTARSARAWVELAALREPGLIAPAVAGALGIREEVASGDVQALVGLIGDRRALLVLDNCEHLVDACAELAHALLLACPGLAILATSREALGVRGERAWLVPPLSLPDTAGDAAGSEAVRLFVERAGEVVPGFELGPHNEVEIGEICQQLDGIPLAIELAAARVRVLSPAQILDRLGNIMQLLSSGGRMALPRHRTLRAAIDWSHDLLTEETQLLLRRLSVFRGGFGLDGAEAVGAGPGIDGGPVLELVAGLVDRSMLGMREQMGAARYHMLEAVRQYALERLAASGEEPEVRRRHAVHVLGQVREAEPHLIRSERPLWVARLQQEVDNIRSALAWTRDHDPAMHVELVGRLWWFWYSTHHWAESGRWIDGALALPEATGSTHDRARLRFAAGALATLQVRVEPARTSLEAAAELAREAGDDRLEAYAVNYLAMTLAGEGRPEALPLCQWAEAWFREHDDPYGLRLALLLRGRVAMARRDFDGAARHSEEGVHVARRFGLDRELAISLLNLAAVHIATGDPAAAEPLVLEALGACRRDPSYFFTAIGVGYLGEIRGHGGRPLEAARLMGAAEGLRDRIGAARFRIDSERQDAAVVGFRATAGDAAFDATWQEGRALDLDRVLEEVLPGAPAGAPAAGGGRVAPAVGRGAGTAPAAGATSPAALRVAALGGLEVEVEGRRLGPDDWSYAKPKELLVYLLLHPEGQTRDRIAEALWPGAARSNLKNSFHVTLHHLRKALGHPEWIGVDGDRYRLDPGLRPVFDADRFEAAARTATRPAAGPGPVSSTTASLREILALYRGDLLADEVAGRWIDDHRDRLRRVHVEVTLALGAALERDGDPAAAAELYHRLAVREELDEGVHRRLMAVWARSGERVRALRHYDRLVALLRETLDADPEPDTAELSERIRAGAV